MHTSSCLHFQLKLDIQDGCQSFLQSTHTNSFVLTSQDPVFASACSLLQLLLLVFIFQQHFIFLSSGNYFEANAVMCLHSETLELQFTGVQMIALKLVGMVTRTTKNPFRNQEYTQRGNKEPREESWAQTKETDGEEPVSPLSWWAMWYSQTTRCTN